jgi:hypothetical protein
MTSHTRPAPERWRNVRIVITFPVPDDDYDLYADQRLNGLTDTVMDLFPQAVMSSGLVSSDGDDAA